MFLLWSSTLQPQLSQVTDWLKAFLLCACVLIPTELHSGGRRLFCKSPKGQYLWKHSELVCIISHCAGWRKAREGWDWLCLWHWEDFIDFMIYLIFWQQLYLQVLKLPPNVCRPECFLFPTWSIQFWLWSNLGTLCRAKRIIVRTVIILGRGCLPLGLTWPGGARDRGTAGRTGVHLWWNLQYSHPDISHSVPLLCSAGSAVGQKNEDISQTATVTPWLTSNKGPSGLPEYMV